MHEKARKEETAQTVHGLPARQTRKKTMSAPSPKACKKENVETVRGLPVRRKKRNMSAPYGRRLVSANVGASHILLLVFSGNQLSTSQK